MPLDYSERRKVEGWQFDNDFYPGSFPEAEKGKVIHLKDCVLHMRIVKDLRPPSKPYRSPK